MFAIFFILLFHPDIHRPGAADHPITIQLHATQTPVAKAHDVTMATPGQVLSSSAQHARR